MEVAYSPTNNAEGYVIEAGQSDWSEKQTITQQTDLKWAILGVDTENTNNILITSTEPTTQTLGLFGTAAYNNGPDIMNKVCRTLYSNISDNSEARSMNIEDINNCLGFEPTRGQYLDTDSKWKPLPSEIKNLHDLATNNLPQITYNDEQMPLWRRIAQDKARKPNFFKTPNRIQNVDDKTGNLLEGNTLANYPLDRMSYHATGNVSNMSIADYCTSGHSGTITANEKNLIFGYALDKTAWQPPYWLASRGVYPNANVGFVYFGPSSVDGGFAGSDGGFFFGSDGGAGGGTRALRPVVSVLKSKFLPENYIYGVEEEFQIDNIVEALSVETENYSIEDYTDEGEEEEIYWMSISPKTETEDETNIDNVLENISTNGNIEIYKGNDKIIDYTILIATGMEIKIFTPLEEKIYKVVVNGDLTGDGNMTGSDLLKMARYMVGYKDTELKGAYLKAADLNNNNVAAENEDLLKMARILVGLDSF